MALRERALWKTIKPILNACFYAYRIESSVTPGFPDVVLINKNTAEVYFVELKALRNKSHIPAHGGLSTSQRNFHTAARTSGANNFVLALDGNDHYYIYQPDGVNPIKPSRITDIKRLCTILRLRS